MSLLLSIREGNEISDLLTLWRKEQNPSFEDFRLAEEISSGACKMKLALNWFTEQLCSKKPSLRLREEILIQTALYQHFFMHNLSLRAIIKASVDIAGKYGGSEFVSFLNRLLRKLENSDTLKLPSGMTIPEISIRYSYPKFLVKELIKDYGLEETKDILRLGNTDFNPMFRIRPGTKPDLTANYPGVRLIAGILTPIAVVENREILPKIAASANFYMQNATPPLLMQTMAKNAPYPQRVLDLCASPGGTSVTIFDLFPNIELFANDVSAKKLEILADNLSKYGVRAVLSCSRGENFLTDRQFDLVILDVPC